MRKTIHRSGSERRPAVKSSLATLKEQQNRCLGGGGEGRRRRRAHETAETYSNRRRRAKPQPRPPPQPLLTTIMALRRRRRRKRYLHASASANDARKVGQGIIVKEVARGGPRGLRKWSAHLTQPRVKLGAAPRAVNNGRGGGAGGREPSLLLVVR